ncbi:P-loop containing nucleoside triphosphate hydrolases superfamily protein isoform 2 [Hibiscus syriacus]|uniref:P-loop containing nucleoside triphosphate hydrolases superfamily protein isoform 2 n=1 Tax=Hibiscus syriacus TaxID=106335 RepID=A0A6A2Y3X9_HIBSY|nr:kinesin-like protein KIN-5D [Hibiscus syriacus]KAE8670456.1 P-loop containing nucleoside triphosphate hydrolases superfamily protein isoform 2 [Hibiscus syriacus]
MESTQQQRRGGGLVSLSPSQTPRSNDKSVRDLRSVDSNSSSKNDKDKGVNVQVILRCRPLSEDEARINTPVVISCNETRREVCAVQSIANKQIDRTFLFDKVFGPSSQQKELFDLAVSPIVNEVLEGYNCTIFAYGQTGTGKTYTMEGEARKKNGEFPSDAGVIPRAVKQIFDILQAQNAEYSMKVTFLELYNEEITDLLAPEETTKFVDDKTKKPIALMEDGKGGVFVRGLEEEIVTTANEIYKILEKGSAKRRTAETLLNKQSSRSHSIFSITIHIKECTPEGEEMIKCGKLNLVDLAGSENISRSGAREGRAREAGEINKSLLTLGRVINALVEHSGHVPYRDSKLTRLLRDSLGGKTKTCIIATISPSIHCLEETLSTLDYAHRAKNIKNKPEINQKMMKSALIKDLYSEIDRLKQEVYSAREKNGIYIPRDRFLQDEAEKKDMAEKIERMELESVSKEKQITELQELYNSQQLLTADLSEKLEKKEKKLEETEYALFDLEDKHRKANATIKEKEFLISNLLKSEKTLVDCAFELRADLENAASDVSDLFSKIERKDKIEDGNKALIRKFQSQLTQQLDILHKTVATSVTQQEKQLKHMEEDMHSFVSTKSEATEELRGRLRKLKSTYGSGVKALDNIASKLNGNFVSTLGDLNSEVSKHLHDVEDLFKRITSEAEALLECLQSSLYKQEEKLTAFTRQQYEAHSRAVDNARSISKTTVNFFETLDMHASKLTKIAEEAQIMNDNKLTEFEKKFEECAANEEKQMLQKVAELLAASIARKKKLVQMAVHDLRDNASSKTSELQKEMSTMKESTTVVKTEWNVHMGTTESHYIEDTSAVESEKKDMQEVLENCMKKAKMSAQQWRNAQESLLSLEKRNVDSVDSIVRGGMEAHQIPRDQFSGAVSTALEDVDTASNCCLTSIDHSLQLDHEACGNMNSMIIPCCEELRELKGGHYHKIVEISENAGKCLEEEYMVDNPLCTPRKRAFNLPSMSSIEELKTPPFEELLKVLWEAKTAKLGNGDIKHTLGEYEATSTAPPLKDSRLPLTAIN